MADIPLVFVSATREDLKEHRAAAAKAIDDAGCHAVLMESFASEDEAPLDVCLREVERCDALVVLVAHRYGWIPPAQSAPKDKSITWLECLHARKAGIPIYAFVIDDGHPWGAEKREIQRVLDAHVKGEDVTKVSKAVKKSEAQLKKFKGWLDSALVRTTFREPETVRSAVLAALTKSPILRSGGTRVPSLAARAAVRKAYVEELLEATRWIDIRGLTVGGTKVYRVEIERLYVTLKTAGTELRGRGKAVVKKRVRRIDAVQEMRGAVPLEEALAAKRLVIQGDAGSGKTTFLRKMVRKLCLEKTAGFPLWIRVAALDEHMAKSSGVPGTPLRSSAKWIPHYLASHTKLTEAVAAEVLSGKDGVLFLDGLDEAPNELRRRGFAKLLEEAARIYPNCRIVVTTRPAAYQGDAVLAGFETVRIEELDDEAVNQFLELWSGFLYPGDAAGAAKHQRELRRALDGKAEIKRLARNPVMLTALAVLQQNDRVLPELRAELYESILEWLAKAREEKAGRSGPAQCLAAMGRLAWAMHTKSGGRVAQMGRQDAAAELGFGNGDEALEKLAEEELESGIVVRRGSDSAFWHLTFQEYLAARNLAGKPDEEQYRELFAGRRLYAPEWRETMLLFAGVLATRQGVDKVKALFSRVTEKIGAKAPFADKARCVGLLAAMVGDLRPLAFEPECPAYTAMVKEMARLFEKGGAAGLDLATRVAAAEALGVSGHPAIYLPGDEKYWISLAGGTIVIGETKKKVTVAPFQMGQNPVTVWEYSKFVEEGGAVPEEWEEQLLHPARPVVGVSWHDATAYCQWAEWRLASEEEWEFGARGMEGREWAWGNDKPTEAHANIERWVGAPSPVGMFPEGNTPEGLVDMSGNVWEWTSSPWDENKNRRVLRGGAWSSTRDDARGAYRARNVPDERSNLIGFRCARTKS